MTWAGSGCRFCRSSCHPMGVPRRTPVGGGQWQGREDTRLSLAGAWQGSGAARALANHFDRVTLVERDELTPGSRSPQGRPPSATCPWLVAVGLSNPVGLFSRDDGRAGRPRGHPRRSHGRFPLVPIRRLEAARGQRARSHRRQPTVPRAQGPRARARPPQGDTAARPHRRKSGLRFANAARDRALGEGAVDGNDRHARGRSCRRRARSRLALAEVARLVGLRPGDGNQCSHRGGLRDRCLRAARRRPL